MPHFRGKYLLPLHYDPSLHSGDVVWLWCFRNNSTAQLKGSHATSS